MEARFFFAVGRAGSPLPAVSASEERRARSDAPTANSSQDRVYNRQLRYSQR
jgi:hypothetical protein